MSLDREKNPLPGKVEETPSSDAAIARTLRALQNEIPGLTGTIIEDSQIEVYPPRSVTASSKQVVVEDNETGQSSIVPIRNLTPKHSRLALSIHNGRAALKLKKAA